MAELKSFQPGKFDIFIRLVLANATTDRAQNFLYLILSQTLLQYKKLFANIRNRIN
jgi:hypothetical protein